MPLARLARAGMLAVLVLPAFAQKPDTVRFVLTGDSIINLRISIYDEPDYVAMLDRIRSADVAFTNLETVIHNYDLPGSAQSGGTYLGSPAWVLEELKWAGFRLFATANNHTTDYGVAGMRSTLSALAAAGVTYAGTGETLARARAPGYLDTKKGRVALVACASTFPEAAAAGQQRPDLPGRPGLNPLRYTTTYTVDRGFLDTIRKLTGSRANAPRLSFLGAQFIEGGAPGVHTEPSPSDLEGIVASIRNARREADWVIASMHVHLGQPGDRQRPPDFIVKFAHAAVDAGADIVVGHGPHVLRGVEIYKGKPILYSIGNFIFENETLPYLPQENYDQYGLPLEALPADFYDARSQGDTRSYPADRLNWESAIAEVAFDADRKLREVAFTPIVLGYGQDRLRRGRPRPATGDKAREIVERLAALSAPFGTGIEFTGGRGIVKLQ
jgi:poly-gamma-glutamate capsule biosynthesis protein CapA/YwtB (metallophosphatase superfamily)